MDSISTQIRLTDGVMIFFWFRYSHRDQSTVFINGRQCSRELRQSTPNMSVMFNLAWSGTTEAWCWIVNVLFAGGKVTWIHHYQQSHVVSLLKMQLCKNRTSITVPCYVLDIVTIWWVFGYIIIYYYNVQFNYNVCFLAVIFSLGLCNNF